MKRVIISMTFLVIFLISLGLQTLHAQDESEVKLFISGPDALGISEKAVYIVTIVGGPAEKEGGKWRVAAYLTGANITDASPTLADSFNETQESNVFQINVTAPPLPQTVVLNVQGASLHGNESVLVEDKYTISVVKPINLRATIVNPSNITLQNVLVNFKVDGKLVGSAEPIEEIGPSGEGTASYSWITRDISPGWHKLEIEIDLNGDGIVDETRGEALFVEGFYGPPGPPSLIVIILIILLILVIVIMLPSTLRKKRRKR